MTAERKFWGDWEEWDGVGVKPYGNSTMVKVHFRGRNWSNQEGLAGSFQWDHTGAPSDILMACEQVVVPATFESPPTPFWARSGNLLIILAALALVAWYAFK